jgi:hypothetical protein
MSRQSRFDSLFDSLRRPFALHTRSTRHRSCVTHAARLGLECLEDRRVLSASWLGQIGGAGDDFPYYKQVMDSAGNIYLNGAFQQTVDFDPSAGVMSLTSLGGYDGFVAKYASDGAVQWARRVVGSTVDSNLLGLDSVVVDPTGQFLYATGMFQASADFTGDGVADATARGQNDVFLLKLDAATGQTVWFKTVGSLYQDEGNEVATDGVSVYVTGSFRGSADFDPGPNNVTLIPAGNGNSNKQRESDAFVWKLDAAGNFVSAWRLGGTYAGNGLTTDAGQSIALDGSTLYLQGTFGGTVDFDLGAGVQNRTSVGRTDTFIAQYTTAGALAWVKTIGGANHDNGFDLSADGASLYLTGDFTGAIDFDPGPGTAVLNSGSAYSDVAIAKYSKTNGSLSWARQFGGAQNENADGRVLSDSTNGTVYFGINSVSPTIDFKPAAAGGEFTIQGPADGFLVKLDASGVYLNAWQVGGPGYAGIPRPVGLANGTLYVAGSFDGTATFPTGGNLTSNGARDLYLMAFDDPAALPAAAFQAAGASLAAL